MIDLKVGSLARLAENAEIDYLWSCNVGAHWRVGANSL